MSRLVNRPIEVQLNDGRPVSFVDGDVRHEIVKIRDWWAESAEWWMKEKPRTVYQVVTSDGYMFDIQEQGGNWIIYRVWD